jgi:hypothetical protein
VLSYRFRYKNPFWTLLMFSVFDSISVEKLARNTGDSSSTRGSRPTTPSVTPSPSKAQLNPLLSQSPHPDDTHLPSSLPDQSSMPPAPTRKATRTISVSSFPPSPLISECYQLPNPVDTQGCRMRRNRNKFLRCQGQSSNTTTLIECKSGLQ